VSEEAKALRAQEVWTRRAPGEVTAAVVARGNLDTVLGLASGEVLVLDGAGGEALRVPSEDGPVTALAVTDDGALLAAAHPWSVDVWSRAGRRIDSLGLPDICCLDLRRRDGTLFAASTQGRFAVVRRGARQSQLGQLSFKPCGIRAGDDGWEFLAGGARGEFAVYDPGGRLLWRIRLNDATGPPAGDVRGRLIVLPAAGMGACAFDPTGASLGVYETPTPPELAAVAPGAKRLAVAGIKGGLYFLTRERGFCVWREEGRGPLLALGLGTSNLVAVDKGGGVRNLLLGGEEMGRAKFLELRHEVQTAHREPAWTIPLPPRHGPFLGRNSVSRDGRWLAARIGGTVTVWNRRGRAVFRKGFEEARLLWGEGSRLFLVGPQGVTACNMPDGPAWEWGGQARDIATGDHTTGLALLDDLGTIRLIGPEGGERWARETPEEPLSVHADEDLEVVGVCGLEGNVYLMDSEGRPLWKRPLPRGAQVLLAGKHVFLVGSEGEISCYGYHEGRDWRMRTFSPVSRLFREGERAFLATSDNRFYRIEPEGEIVALDRRSDSGSSRLALTASGQWRELHVRGDRLTCFDMEGSILWGYRASGPIDPRTLTSGGGALAFVAGQEMVFFTLEKEEAAAPTRYLEI